MLTLWAKRETHGKRLGVALAVLIAVFGGYYVLVSRPAKLSEERARLEITETLPKALRQAHADVMAVAGDDAAKQKAAALLADGERAISSGDRAAMTKIDDRTQRTARRADARIHAHHRIAPG